MVITIIIDNTTTINTITNTAIIGNLTFIKVVVFFVFDAFYFILIILPITITIIIISFIIVALIAITTVFFDIVVILVIIISILILIIVFVAIKSFTGDAVIVIVPALVFLELFD